MNGTERTACSTDSPLQPPTGTLTMTFTPTDAQPETYVWDANFNRVGIFEGDFTTPSTFSLLDRMPKAWELQASPDGVTWVTVAARSNQIGWSTNEVREFTI